MGSTLHPTVPTVGSTAPPVEMSMAAQGGGEGGVAGGGKERELAGQEPSPVGSCCASGKPSGM